jgi:hypothetical protein
MARTASTAIDRALDELTAALAEASHQAGLLRYQSTLFDRGENPEHRAHAEGIAAALGEALDRVGRAREDLNLALAASAPLDAGGVVSA